jgi:hypothetical protein
MHAFHVPRFDRGHVGSDVPFALQKRQSKGIGRKRILGKKRGLSLKGTRTTRMIVAFRLDVDDGKPTSPRLAEQNFAARSFVRRVKKVELVLLAHGRRVPDGAPILWLSPSQYHP